MISALPISKPILYIDMDNVLVDFQSGINNLSEYEKREYEGRYILSTAPWNNPSAWSDKLVWVKKWLGTYSYKRLILSHHKNLNKGDFLIDDRLKNGAENFSGELILFGSEQYPNWDSVVDYLISSK